MHRDAVESISRRARVAVFLATLAHTVITASYMRQCQFDTSLQGLVPSLHLRCHYLFLHRIHAREPADRGLAQRHWFHRFLCEIVPGSHRVTQMIES
jgi:hypothetical protein